MDELAVSVVYCPDETCITLELRVPDGSTVAHAIACSRLLDQRAELDPAALSVGIHGRRTSTSTVLREGDRVEIYRGLQADPREARRKKAAQPGRSGLG